MTDWLKEIEERYHASCESNKDSAIIYQADVGYLLKRLGYAEQALKEIFHQADVVFVRNGSKDRGAK